MCSSLHQPSHRNERETQASYVPVLHSILLPEALLAMVLEEYDAYFDGMLKGLREWETTL
jgi:hypothetical protein